MKIVVTGSLGHISKPLTEELIKQKHTVTVITSHPERQKDIEAMGANAAVGLLDDTAFLGSVFSGADAAYCMLPPNFAEQDQIGYDKRLATAYVSAVKSAAVKRIVHLSSYGAHLEKGTGFILGSYESEKIFNTLSGVIVTHIRAGYFYYNLLNFIPMIKSAGMIAANYGGIDKLAMVAPEDIAVAVAEELTTTEKNNKIRYVASDDITCNEAALILGEAIDKPGLKWVAISDDEMQQGLESHGMPGRIAALFVELGAAIHTGVLRGDYERNKPVLGNIKLRDYAKEFAAAYEK